MKINTKFEKNLILLAVSALTVVYYTVYAPTLKTNITSQPKRAYKISTPITG